MALSLPLHSQNSNLQNQARLKVLKSREDHVFGVVEEARRRLGQITSDLQRYGPVLQALIVQGLFQVGGQLTAGLCAGRGGWGFSRQSGFTCGCWLVEKSIDISWMAGLR